MNSCSSALSAGFGLTATPIKPATRGAAFISPLVSPTGIRRTVASGRLKRAGIHDLFFLRPTQFAEGIFGLLFGLELKEPNGGGRLSPAQQKMHPRLLRSGLAKSIVLDNLEECKKWLIDNGLAIS
jgi:hypothetical protein